MLSPVSGDVAGGSIVRHLLPLVMTMVMMAVVSSPVRLGKRIGPERGMVMGESLCTVRKLDLYCWVHSGYLWCGDGGFWKRSSGWQGTLRRSLDIVIIIYLLRVLMVPFCGSSFSPAGSV